MNPYTTGNCCILYQTFHSFTHNIMKENVITEVSRNKSDRQMLGATYRKVKLVENASNMKARSEGKLAEYVGAAWHWLVQYIRRTERMWPNYQACEQHFFFLDVYSGGRVWGSAQFSRTQGVFLIY